MSERGLSESLGVGLLAAIALGSLLGGAAHSSLAHGDLRETLIGPLSLLMVCSELLGLGVFLSACSLTVGLGYLAMTFNWTSFIAVTSFCGVLWSLVTLWATALATGG